MLKNIDCGYSLEPPRRGGSNEYPQCFEQKYEEYQKFNNYVKGLQTDRVKLLNNILMICNSTCCLLTNFKHIDKSLKDTFSIDKEKCVIFIYIYIYRLPTIIAIYFSSVYPLNATI